MWTSIDKDVREPGDMGRAKRSRPRKTRAPLIDVRLAGLLMVEEY